MVKNIITRFNRTIQKKTGLMGLRIKRLKSLKRNPKRLKRLEQIYYDKTEAELNRASANTWAKLATGPHKSPLMSLDAIRGATINNKDEIMFEERAKKRQALLKRQRKRI